MSPSAREYLYQNLKKDHEKMIGLVNQDLLTEIVDAWMNDESNSEGRFNTILKYFPKSCRLLDMAAGCGTFVFYGLQNGFDVHGVEPEEWKLKFNAMKASENSYPSEWLDRIKLAYGENLPYENDYFDVVTSYQTLEHVSDVSKCLEEMLRVVKSGGGGLHIMCPDYRSTFEGHYMLPWLPLLPINLAKLYVQALGRKSEYIDTLNYTTTKMIIKALVNIANEHNYQITIVDVKKESFVCGLKKRRLSAFNKIYFIWQIWIYIKKLFRSEVQTNLIIYKN